MFCPTCGQFHEPGQHGPAVLPERPPERPPEQPAPPPPDDSPTGDSGASASGAADGGEPGTDGDREGEEDGNGAAAAAEPRRPNGAEGAAVTSGGATHLPPPPPIDNPGIWHQYLQQLPPQEKARRQAARAHIQSELADLNRGQRIEQGGRYVQNTEEQQFLEYTGHLPTLDDETDEAMLTAERISREKAAAAEDRRKAREEGRLRRSDEERNRVIGAPNATIERDEYGTIIIDGRRVAGTSSSGGVITYTFEDGGIERFVLETSTDGGAQPDFSKGQVIRGVPGQKSLAEQYRAVSLDTDEARAWQQSEMNRISALPEPMQEEFRWYVGQVMSASNQNQLDAAQKALADRWEEYGDTQTHDWRTKQLERISARVPPDEQAEFQHLVNNVANAKTADERNAANKVLSERWEAWESATHERLNDQWGKLTRGEITLDDLSESDRALLHPQYQERTAESERVNDLWGKLTGGEITLDDLSAEDRRLLETQFTEP